MFLTDLPLACWNLTHTVHIRAIIRSLVILILFITTGIIVCICKGMTIRVLVAAMLLVPMVTVPLLSCYEMQGREWLMWVLDTHSVQVDIRTGPPLSDYQHSLPILTIVIFVLFCSTGSAVIVSSTGTWSSSSKWLTPASSPVLPPPFLSPNSPTVSPVSLAFQSSH